MEIWKDVIGYEGIYQVSHLGSIKSLSRIILRNGKYPFISKEITLKKCLNNRGYLTVNLSKNGNKKVRTVHQLVAEAFLGHTPCGYELVVDHKNNIKTDNRFENLHIVTARVNSNKKHLKSSSQYVGVSLCKKNKKWISQININDKRIFLGSFYNEVEASQYYENALKNYNLGLPISIKKYGFSSDFKGVSFNKQRKKWNASITIKNKRTHLGLFDTEIEAHNAYQKAKQLSIA